VEELAHQHLRHAARAAFDLWQAQGFQHLAIGGPDAVLSELESALHPYLRERLCGRVHTTVGASDAEVREAAEAVEADVERAREAALVERLREAAATGRKGVGGLAGTLAALNEHRVERLLVSKGYAESGWRCPETGALAVKGPTNPANGVAMERVDDVVEDAIEAALTQGLPVTICVGNADLDVLGRIGALLRY
jgi:peptide subunit release factor 1 (eRF1)